MRGLPSRCIVRYGFAHRSVGKSRWKSTARRVRREEDALRLGLPTDGKHTGGCLSHEAPLALSCWRTKNTVNILVSKPDAELILDKLQQMEREAGDAAAAAAVAV